MLKKKTLIRVVPFTVLLVTIYSVISFTTNPNNIVADLNITIVWWVVNFLVLSVFWQSKKVFFNQTDSKNFKIIQFYLLWNVISILRGCFIVENYWDWKGLIVNAMALTMPIIAYTASNSLMVQSIFSFYIKYALPVFVLFVFFITPDAWGFYLVPIGFLLLFLPALGFRWKVMLIAIAVFVISANFGARSNVIKFVAPIFLLSIYYFKKVVPQVLMESVRKFFFILPIFLFVLAVSGVFNIFKMDDYIKSDYNQSVRDSSGYVVQENLKGDTRTFLYVEVIQTALKFDSWWFGRSPARGNLSASFGDEDMSHRGERLTNEVAILNVFNWTGLFGVLFYMIVFYKASYLAVNDSNNIFSKIMGIFLSFRWLYAWIEDVNTFSLTTMFLWILVGMCLSKSFRNMNNREIKIWVRGIFDKRYIERNNFSKQIRHVNIKKI